MQAAGRCAALVGENSKNATTLRLKGKSSWRKDLDATRQPCPPPILRVAAVQLLFDSISTRETAWVKEYLPKAAALVAKHGGKALVGGNSTPRLLALEGKPPLAVVILEFPSLELAQAWHDDPDYAPLKQLRQANVDMEVFVVERV
jgi:uncharacterized protein (DUF1330 family)